MTGWETIVGHIVILIAVISLGLMHRHDLKKITIEFKNGKDKPEDERISVD